MFLVKVESMRSGRLIGYNHFKQSVKIYCLESDLKFLCISVISAHRVFL